MTDPGFRIDGVQQGIPFRQRTAFASYLVFAGQEGAVLVEPATARQLRSAAERAWPDETGGLLTGRALCDADGTYVAVSGFVEASPEAGSPGTFVISPEETAGLRELAFGAHPAADVVGWWHSHLGPSGYSNTDLDTQATWTQRESVGLLVFARGESWGTAYLGPNARRLGPVGRLPALGPAATVSAAVPAAQPTAGKTAPAAGVFRSGRPQLTQRFWKIAILAMPLIIGSLLAASVLGGFALFSHQVTGSLQDLSGQVSRQRRAAGQVTAGQPGKPSVTWSCVRHTTAYSCTAQLWRLSGTVVWLLDGSTLAYGPRVSVPRQKDGRPHTLAVLVTNDTGTYSAGQQALQ